jgi:carbon starvation protein CstA
LASCRQCTIHHSLGCFLFCHDDTHCWSSGFNVQNPAWRQFDRSIAGVTLVCAAVFFGPYIAIPSLRWFTLIEGNVRPVADLWLCAAAIPVWLLLYTRGLPQHLHEIGVSQLWLTAVFVINI